ncbi:MAG: lysylphosphatidylglycerol synthase transmembrane domain-containing protein [Bacillota bacterium]
MTPKTLRITAGIAISLAFLAGAFYKVRLGELWTALKGINLFALLMCLFFFGISCIFRAVMWRVTTRPLQQVGFSALFGGVIVGYMANNLLPVRAGELVRTYYLAARTGIPGAAVFSTVCIERVLDLVSLGLLLAAGIFWGIRGLTPHTAGLTLVVLATTLAAGALILSGLVRLNKLPEKSGGILVRACNRVKEFLEPVGKLQQSKTLLLLVGLSLAAWASNYLSLLPLVYGAQNRPEAALLLLLFINLGLLIPSSPGALGVMQVAFWTALAPFGISKEQALALSLAYQGGLYLFTLAVGLPYAAQAPVKLTKIAASQPLTGAEAAGTGNRKTR